MSSTSFSVAVIIPVFNAELFLARAVASAISLPTVSEILLVEDGSTDHSMDVCRRLVAANPDRIRLFQHTGGRNCGAGASRNRGLSEARAPYVAFLDADDYYLPNRFKIDAELFQRDEALDGVYNALGTDIMDEAGRMWFRKSRRPCMTTIRHPPQPERLFFCMGPIGTAGYFSLDGLTVRRRVIKQCEKFSDLRLAQDTLFCVQLAARFRLTGGQTREPVAMRCVHRNNRIQDNACNREAVQTFFQALITWAQTANLSPQKMRAIHQARLTRCPTWNSLRSALKETPSLMRHPSTWGIIAHWMCCRRYPDDPPLPGLFPWHLFRASAPARLT